MFKDKNNFFIILGLIITIIICSGTNLSKVNSENNPIHLLEFHKIELFTDFKTESSIFSSQSGEATVSDWDRLLDKFRY
ncbi:MAG: hypothetical protein ACXVHV_11155 [Methanobacterium sp.]